MRVPPPLPSTVIWHASAFPLVVLQDDTWEDMETMLDDAAEEAELIQKWWPQRALALGSVIDKRTGSGNVRQVKIVYAGRAKDHAVWENHKAHLPSSLLIPLSSHPSHSCCPSSRCHWLVAQAMETKFGTDFDAASDLFDIRMACAAPAITTEGVCEYEAKPPPQSLMPPRILPHCHSSCVVPLHSPLSPLVL